MNIAKMLKSLALTGAALIFGMAQAETVLVTGVLDRVEYGISTEFQAGQRFTLVYEFDPAATDFSTLAGRGDYRQAVISSRLTIGSYILETNGGAITVDDDPFGGMYDRYAWSVSASSVPFSGMLVNDLKPIDILWQLTDPTATAITGKGLSSSPPELSSFASGYFTFAFAQALFPGYALGVSTAYGTIESVSAVPEPNVVIMMALGLVCVFLISKRRRC